MIRLLNTLKRPGLFVRVAMIIIASLIILSIVHARKLIFSQFDYQIHENRDISFALDSGSRSGKLVLDEEITLKLRLFYDDFKLDPKDLAEASQSIIIIQKTGLYHRIQTTEPFRVHNGDQISLLVFSDRTKLQALKAVWNPQISASTLVSQYGCMFYLDLFIENGILGMPRKLWIILLIMIFVVMPTLMHFKIQF